jgi:hypothetical protein
MPGCKHPNIDSRAAPDRKTISRNSTRRRRRGRRSKLEPMIDYKYPTIASGATPIGSTGRAPDEK